MNLDLDRRTLGLLAGVLVAAVAATMFLTGRGQSAEPVTLASMAAVPLASAVAASPSPSVSAQSQVVVEVVGKVRQPAVLTLPEGSRVQDALEAAGGARHGVDTTDQNLARVLVDGEQIRIGLRPAPAGDPADTTGSTAAGLIDINTASMDQLQQIPGVGPVLAQRIVTYREQNGGFQAVEQLTEVSGIGEATFAQMQPMVTVGAGG